MKKRNIIKLKLHEVSAVDKPAQSGARVVLIKRAGATEVDATTKGMFEDALTDIVDNRDLTDEVSATEQIMMEMSDSHWALREALQATISFDVIADKQAAINSIASEYFEKVHDMLGQLSNLLISKGGNTMNQEEMTALIKKTVTETLGDKPADADGGVIAESIIKALDPMVQENRETLKVASLPAAHREYLEDISKAADITDDKKAELRKQFLADETTDENREAVVKAWTSSGEIFKAVDGRVLKRSELGAAFDLLVAEVKKGEERDKELADLKKRDEDKALIAKSRSEFPNIAGDDATRLTLEKTLQSLPEDEAEKMRAVLKSTSTVVGKSLETVGNSGIGTDADSPTAKLEAMAHNLVSKTENGISYADAYQKVLDTPEGDALYEAHVAEMAGRAS